MANRAQVSVVAVIAGSILLAAVNVFLMPRDGIATLGVTSYDIADYQSQQLLEESAIQILYTYFSSEAVLLNPGIQEQGGFSFSKRLSLEWGERVGTERPTDVRNIFDADTLDALKSDLATDGWSSMDTCPHDASDNCTVTVMWNDQVRGQPDLGVLFLRVGEHEYAILDETFFDEKQEGDDE